MADVTYDMKKTLLDLKNELLKSSASHKEDAECSALLNQQADGQISGSSEILYLLREISSNQNKIIDILAEINSKIGGI